MAFKSKPNCGVSKSDLDRGFTDGMYEKMPQEDESFMASIFRKDCGEYIGQDDVPELKPGFLGRSEGKER